VDPHQRFRGSELCNVTDQLHGRHLNWRDQLKLGSWETIAWLAMSDGCSCSDMSKVGRKYLGMNKVPHTRWTAAFGVFRRGIFQLCANPRRKPPCLCISV
jgi:hypothetical protein